MWLVLPLAFADAVSFDSSLDCPPGSSITASHSGSWCQPQDCTQSTCSTGQCTEDIGLCVTREEVACGGMRSDSGECTFEKTEAHGTCKRDSDCSQGSCEIKDRCASLKQRACGGCGTTGAAGVGLILLGVAGFVRREE